MIRQTANAIGQFTAEFSRWIDTRCYECNHCRECQKPVRPWDEVCDNCGCGQPAKVSFSAGVVVVAACGILLLLAVAGRWAF